MFTLKAEGRGALYRQVYEGLRSAILEGRLAPGARMPSTRSLAREMDISRNTVLLAFDQLAAEGYVTGRTGSGTFVAPELPDDLLSPAGGRPSKQVGHQAPLRLSAYGRRAIEELPPGWSSPTPPTRSPRYDFRYGLPAIEEFPQEIWRRLIARRARTASLRSLRYGPVEGYGPLREAIAGYVRRSRAVVCEPGQVLIVNGSQQGLDLAARVLLDPGDGVVIEEPQYQGARKIFATAGARLLPVPVDSEGLDTSALPGPGSGARLAYVTPSHQFPTGAVLSLARRLALLAWAQSLDAYILEDDYDSEYRYEGRPVEAVQGLDRNNRVLYVGTFSKVLFPSLRVGYMVLPEALVEPFAAAKWLADRQTSTLEQEVLADFIAEGHFERHLRRSRARNASRRAALLAALRDELGDRVEVSGAKAGIHTLVWLRDVPHSGVDALVERALAAGVGIYPATQYYLDPPPRAGLLVGYVSLTEREIREGVRRLAGVL